jgi:hypothetical protein
MGMYTWLSEGQFEEYSKVSDQELNEILQEVRSLMPNVYVQESQVSTCKGMFYPVVKKTVYSVYSRTITGQEEVRVLNIKTTDKDYVANYLFGLLNGYRAAAADNINSKT